MQLTSNTDSARRKLTPPQFAKQYGVSTAKVLAWIAAGELRAINAATRATGERPRWLIDLADVEAFERARASVAPKPVTTRRRRAAKQSSVTTYF